MVTIVRFGRSAVAALVLGLVGCDASREPAPTAGPRTTVSTAPTTTPTKTTAPAPTPVTVDGPCPYLDGALVEETVGQRLGRTSYTTKLSGQPPDCTFHRADGDVAVRVEIGVYAGPVEAQLAAVELVEPDFEGVDGLGDTAVVAVDDDTVLAVVTGATLLTVRLNQPSSLQARALAAAVLPTLGG